MDAPLIVIICVIALSVLAATWTILSVRRGHGMRRILVGVGLVLLPLMLWVLGLAQLIADGVMAVYDYFQKTSLDGRHTAGLVGLVVALLCLVGGNFVPAITKEDAKARRLAKMGAKPLTADDTRQVGAGTGASVATRTAASGAAPAKAAPAKAPAKGGKAVDPEDAEIEALLRKHGIE